MLQPHLVPPCYTAPAAGMPSAYAMPAPCNSPAAQYMCAGIPHKMGESSTSACWGSRLKGNSVGCTPGFQCEGSRFKNKFCYAYR